MKKFLKRSVVVILVVIVVALAALTFFAGSIVKTAVNRAAPRVLGVPVSVEKVYFKPFAGRFILSDMSVGNPKGFKTPYMFKVSTVDIDVDVASLLSDRIVVRNIIIDSPNITYERGMTSSNFGALNDNLESSSKTDKGGKEEKMADKKGGSGKKVVIDHLVVLDPALNVSIKAAGGKYIPVKLGRVEIEGIGRGRGGVAPADAVKIFLSIITSNINNAVGSAGDLVGAGLDLVGDGTNAAAGVAVEGAKALTGVANDGAKAIEDKVSEGASSVIRGVGKLFGGKDAKDSDSGSEN